MEVDQSKGKSRGKKGRSNRGKGQTTRERAKEKVREDVLDHARHLIGLATALHIMEERASVPPHLARDPRTLHRFDKLTWKVTNMTGSQVQVLL